MKALKFLLGIVLLAGIGYLLYVNVDGMMEPIKFQDEQTAREQEVIQRLKDIRTLQTTFKENHGYYVSTMDSLVNYYKEGFVTVEEQGGAVRGDSLADVHTKEVKTKLTADAKKLAASKKIAKEQIGAFVEEYVNQELKKRFNDGDKNIYYAVDVLIPVRDTLFKSRENFVVDSLAYVPYSGGKKVIMNTIVKTVSGVQVPLFEAKMPYIYYLQGLDKQQIKNLLDDIEKKNEAGLGNEKYKGLMVGSIDNPNNNAGNWE